MTVLTTNGIVGADGKTPVYNPNGLWKQWSLDEVYMGGNADGRYVPNIKDYVVDLSTNITYRVVDIDPTTMVPTLVKVKVLIEDGVFTDEDVLLGVGPGTQSDTYRVYLNDKVMPHTLNVERRLHVNGVSSRFARIFRGSILNSSQHVISAYYDQSGNVLGQDIPLELVKETGNIAVKFVPGCYTTEKMPDGEIVTVVLYNDAGDVVSKRQLLVENTDFISAPNSAAKYVIGISLETPFLSSSDLTLIQYPINVLMQGLNLIGVVRYSDGSVLRMPVDQTKFSLFGFENYASTIVGEDIPLVLNYRLSDDEIAYGYSVSQNRTIPKNFRARTLVADGSYSVKLFAYPVWVDAVNGYRLEWFLANLERTAIWLVTPHVKLNTNGRAFNPIEYGTNQRLSVSVNLKDVNGSFNTYMHTQTIDITLMRPGTDHDTNWTVSFDQGQTTPFGVQAYAESTFVNQNIWRLNVASGAATVEEWLVRMFYRTMPLYDPIKEAVPPVPNFFALTFDNITVEFPLSEWNVTHIVNGSVPNGAAVFVRFFKRTADNDIQLAVAGLTVRQTT